MDDGRFLMQRHYIDLMYWDFRRRELRDRRKSIAAWRQAITLYRCRRSMKCHALNDLLCEAHRMLRYEPDMMLAGCLYCASHDGNKYSKIFSIQIYFFHLMAAVVK